MSTFYTYGIPETRKLVSIHKEESGKMRWEDIMPPEKYLLSDPLAPWNREHTLSSDPLDYPERVWTPPLIVEIVQIPKPSPVPGKIVEPILVWTDTSCTRDWEIRDMTAVELADSLRKVWPNTQAFLAEFTIAELGGIGLSTDPTIAALRLMLSVWSGQIYSDDQRVETGLAALHIAGILTAERRAQISPAPAPAFSGALATGAGTIDPITGTMALGGDLTPNLP